MAAKRRFKNKKVRYIAIGASLVSGAAVATVLLPSANAADELTAEQIITKCQRAEVLNGKQQDIFDFNGHPIAGPSFESDNCDFVETNFETFDGPTEKVTVDFPNCEPNATDPVKVSAGPGQTVGQGQGKYTATQQGGVGGLFSALSGSWLRHKGTLDMTINSTSAKSAEGFEVPVGKVMSLTFTPKMQRMTGEWRVRIDAREATTTTNATPEQNLVAPDVVEGPVILPGAAGKPGLADGTYKSTVEDC
ncbi:hypothetical protein [Streptomyces sp. DSM 40750]|uniref:hypothetical protein n=1 Tax=Streptomyces sp. DSM 40750 TaxID=2801030 RepID=UPI00214AB638|nr:hypothetical protein [Streptomyces sp. DSM 40750]UUU22927.1 hypothetical protein JIX55_23000 [Streptomyces sp. DSM 40750]